LGTVQTTGRARNAAVGGDQKVVLMNSVPLADDVIRTQLAELGLAGGGAVHRNLPPAELIARSLARGEGILAANGALVVKTGEPSGRSPEDRVIVEIGRAHV
jgi:ATP-dependent phosphoenolpyruvate carboxykinase